MPSARRTAQPNILLRSDTLVQRFTWLRYLFMLDSTMAYASEYCLDQGGVLLLVDSMLRGVSQVVAPSPPDCSWQAPWHPPLSHTQVMIINNPATGVLILAALFVPSAFGSLLGLLGLFGATVTAFALGLDRGSIAAGLFGYNGLLVGLGLGAFFQYSQDGWDLGLLIISFFMGGTSTLIQVPMTQHARTHHATPLLRHVTPRHAIPPPHTPRHTSLVASTSSRSQLATFWRCTSARPSLSHST